MPIVDQKLSESSWFQQNAAGKKTLSINDTLQLRNEIVKKTPAEAKYPVPITVKFNPRKNIRYSSRFRFICEYGNSFDVVLQGEGTYEEHEHKPLSPFPK